MGFYFDRETFLMVYTLVSSFDINLEATRFNLSNFGILKNAKVLTQQTLKGCAMELVDDYGCRRSFGMLTASESSCMIFQYIIIP